MSDNVKNKRLLVTGASGFLGWNICREAQGKFETFGTVFTNNAEIPGTKTVQIDLTDFNKMKQLFKHTEPEMVIHAAAASKPEFCQVNRSEADKINVDVSVNIAGLCADRNIPLAFTSTDNVFDGLNPPYSEEDAVNPINCYAEQKILAEEKVLQTWPSASVCRMPLMFGDPGPSASSFFVTMKKALENGEELKLFIDEVRTPVSGRTAAQGLFVALEKAKGILHLGGKEIISRYHFGLLMMDVMGLSEANIVRCSQKDVQLNAPRAPDLTMDSSKAYALGFEPISLREELKRLMYASGS